MKSLMIKDLALDKELDEKTMAAVRGGCDYGWKSPDVCSYEPAPVCYSDPPSYSSAVNTANQTNSIVQGGNVQAANGALTSGGIAITNAPFALGLNMNGSTVRV